MSSNHSSTHRVKEVNLYLPVAVIGLMLMFLALSAHAQTIHQLSYNNSTWIDQNLFGATTDTHTGVAAFVTTPNDQIHTYYLDSADDVHQLYFNGTSWGDENLTAEVSGVPALHKSELNGFSVQNFQYVFYVAQNQHVHQLLYNGTWGDSDLTQLGGGALSSKTPRLAAVLTGSAGFHVYYLTTKGHIVQLYNVSGTWQNQDITATAGGPASKAVWMAAVSIGDFQYVYYVAKTGHVHELYYNDTTWLDEDLTTIAGTPPAASASGVTATVVPGSPNLLSVFVITNNNHVWYFVSADNVLWASQDLTSDSGGPVAKPTSGMTAFATTPNNELHVFYLSKTHVDELFLPAGTGTWQNFDLTAISHGPAANGTSAMAGFSLENLQYLYYVAK